METNGKVIMQITSPALKYRLEILKNACPKTKDFIIVFTDNNSYPHYKEYHDFFQFVILDDYRKNYPISLTHELLSNYDSEEEYFKNITKFYGNTSDTYYPYDLHRFIFPYLMEKNILNFVITDSDFILTNDPVLLNNIFNSATSGTLYGPWFGEDQQNIENKLKFWKNDIQPNFSQIKLESPFLRTMDGYARGFSFKREEDMKLFFDIWNNAIEEILNDANKKANLMIHHPFCYQAEWVIAHIMQFFEFQLGYNYKDLYSIFYYEGRNGGLHKTRPEDSIVLGPREGWKEFNFDYSDTSTIAAFIRNNKFQLNEYYKLHFPIFEITDNFVYTRID